MSFEDAIEVVDDVTDMASGGGRGRGNGSFISFLIVLVMIVGVVFWLWNAVPNWYFNSHFDLEADAKFFLETAPNCETALSRMNPVPADTMQQEEAWVPVKTPIKLAMAIKGLQMHKKALCDNDTTKRGFGQKALTKGIQLLRKAKGQEEATCASVQASLQAKLAEKNALAEPFWATLGSLTPSSEKRGVHILRQERDTFGFDFGRNAAFMTANPHVGRDAHYICRTDETRLHLAKVKWGTPPRTLTLQRDNLPGQGDDLVEAMTVYAARKR